MRSTLATVSSEFPELLERAWQSDTLSQCPTLNDWAEAIDRCVKSYELLEKLEHVIRADSDRGILHIWQQCNTASKITNEFKKHQDRVNLAANRVKALNKLDSALATKFVSQILRAYLDQKSLLDASCTDFIAGHQKQVLILVTFVDSLRQGIRKTDTETVEKLWQQRDNQWNWNNLFTNKEEEFIQLASERMRVYRLVSNAKSRGDLAVVELAEQYQTILDCFDLAQNDPEIQLAQARVRALREYRQMPDDESRWLVYSQHFALLDPCGDFSSHERGVVSAIREKLLQQKTEALREAIWIDDDKAIIDACSISLFTDSRLFSPDEISDGIRTRFLLANERLEALNLLRGAVRSGNKELALEIYDNHEMLLRQCSEFTAQDRLIVMQIRQKHINNQIQNAAQGGQNDKVVRLVEEAFAHGCEVDNHLLLSIRQARLSQASA